jgi:2-iminobutanoate/2-iminopropanoate deaminase
VQEIVHNPVDGIYAATPDYVHALEVRRPERWLYIAGTMGLSADGSAPETLEEQLERIWANIRAILAQANMTTDNIVRLTSYLRDPSYAEANGAARELALGSRRVPTTAIVVQTLDPRWLVEIEAIAVA